MSREIRPGIHWIYEAGPDRRGMFDLDDRKPGWYEPGQPAYIPQCAYLFVGEEETLLFDTLSPASTEKILAETEAILDGRGLDYLVVSHPDVPHAGNTMPLLETYPEAELVAPKYGNDHELYHLDDAIHVGEGDDLDLGELEVGFHEATFLDAPVSIWMTEKTTNTLLPVDWMGFTHLESERLTLTSELDGEFDAERLVEFHGRVLFWYQYVDVEKMNREIDRVIEKFDPDIIAPAHGLVIDENATDYMELMKEVTQTIDERGRVGILG